MFHVKRYSDEARLRFFLVGLLIGAVLGLLAIL